MKKPETSPANSPDDKELFAGYGILRDEAVVERITGSDVKNLGQVGIHHVELVEQKLEDTPAAVQGVIKGNLADAENGQWSSVGAVESRQDQAGVGGTLFEVTEDELARLDDWELADLDWQARQEVVAETAEGDQYVADSFVLQGEQPAGNVLPDEPQAKLTDEARLKVEQRIDSFVKSTAA